MCLMGHEHLRESCLSFNTHISAPVCVTAVKHLKACPGIHPVLQDMLSL